MMVVLEVENKMVEVFLERLRFKDTWIYEGKKDNERESISIKQDEEKKTTT